MTTTEILTGIKNWTNGKFANKVADGIEGNVPMLDENGDLEDSNISADDIAKVDGNYPLMSVGSARNIEGVVPVEDSFLIRPTGGEEAEVANGLAQMLEVKGKSQKWNQLFNPSLNPVTSNTTATKKDTGFSWVGNDLTSNQNIRPNANIATLEVYGHKYYTAFSYKSNLPLGYQSTNSSNDRTLDASNSFIRISYVGSVPSGSASRLQDYYYNYNSERTELWEAEIKDYIRIDLTLLGIDNLTTAAQVEAWLKNNIGLASYYPYTAGIVLNNKMTGMESYKRNLLNPTTGKAVILGEYSELYGNYYGITGTHGSITFTDALGNSSTITPDTDGKFELLMPGELTVATPGSDCSVFLWWDGSKTDYSDYGMDVAKLDITHIYGKKNGEGSLVQVWPTGVPGIGEVVDMLTTEDGAVVAKRVIGEKNMGDLSWNKQTNGGLSANLTYFRAAISGRKIGSLANLCSRYITTVGTTRGSLVDKSIAPYNSTEDKICVCDSAYDSSDAATFKTAMSGILLYYQLATPETYTDLVYQGSSLFTDGTPVTLPVNYNVDNWGIERILPVNGSAGVVTAIPTISCKYSVDANETLNTHRDEIQNLDENKANPDGDYPLMSVGTARNLAADKAIHSELTFDKVPTGAATGLMQMQKVLGRSVVWNQLVQNGNFADASNWTAAGATTLGVADNILTATVGESASTTNVGAYQTSNFIPNHKYYFSAFAKTNNNSSGKLFVGIGGSAAAQSIQTDGVNDTYVHLHGLVTAPSEITTNRLYIGQISARYGVVLNYKNVQVVDLTLGNFGDITTAAEFEALYPLPYYAYNAGQIKNNEATAIESVGFNQWDEEWELGLYDATTGRKTPNNNAIRSKNHIPVFPSTTYYLRVPLDTWKARLFYYDADKNFLSVSGWLNSGTFITPDNAAFITFELMTVTTYNNDICINLSDASLNSTYVPYEKHTLQLGLNSFDVTDGENVIAIQGLKQAGSVCDEIDLARGKFVNRVVKRAYQSGDESDSSVITDGTNTNAPLATPVEYDLVNPIGKNLLVNSDGTLTRKPEDTSSAVAAPLSMDAIYALNAVNILNNLDVNYQSQASMDAFCSMIGTALNGTITKSWDSSNNKYTYTFTPNE